MPLLVEILFMATRLRHLWLTVTTLPGLLFISSERLLLNEMRAFCRHLPLVLKQPLPQAMRQLTPAAGRPLPQQENTLRRLADLAALLERRSPLGLCLRRSLVRYHYLRQAGIPVAVRFGAKFAPGKPGPEIAGHAWLTLDEQPYYEADENWRGFTVMFRWPQA
jgi:hypothetical protein